MHGCIKLIMLKMTLVVVCLKGAFQDCLDFFFKVGIHAFFAKDGAIEGDLRGILFDIFVLFNMRPMLPATCNMLNRVLL